MWFGAKWVSVDTILREAKEKAEMTPIHDYKDSSEEDREPIGWGGACIWAIILAAALTWFLPAFFSALNAILLP